MLFPLRLCLPIICLSLHHTAQAHPHLSKQQATEQLDQLVAALASLRDKHDGKPHIQHPDARPGGIYG